MGFCIVEAEVRGEFTGTRIGEEWWFIIIGTMTDFRRAL